MSLTQCVSYTICSVHPHEKQQVRDLTTGYHWGDGSAGTVPAMDTERPQFNPLNPHWKPRHGGVSLWLQHGPAILAKLLSSRVRERPCEGNRGVRCPRHLHAYIHTNEHTQAWTRDALLNHTRAKLAEEPSRHVWSQCYILYRSELSLCSRERGLTLCLSAVSSEVKLSNYTLIYLGLFETDPHITTLAGLEPSILLPQPFEWVHCSKAYALLSNF